MGRPTEEQRGTRDRGVGDPIRPLRPMLERTTIWSALGESGVPSALSDALRTAAALDEAIDAGDVEMASAYAARLLSTWEFLWTCQTNAVRDARDGALLLTDTLAGRPHHDESTTEKRPGITGEEVRVVTNAGAWPVWAPDRFPEGMSEADRLRYPKRPRHVSEIPPFFPERVREWRAFAELRMPMLHEVVRRERRLTRAEIAGLDAALESTYEKIRRSLVDVDVPSNPRGETPVIDSALRNLAALTIGDMEQQTGARLRDLGGPLLSNVQVILLHAAEYSFVLDNRGEPTNLGGLFDHSILCPPPGSQMGRFVPPPGLYISVQKVAPSTFRLEGGVISKTILGGTGAFDERTLHVRRAHVYHERLESHLERMKPCYVAAISLDSVFHPHEITKARISDKIPELIGVALPYTVAEIVRRAKAGSKDYAKLLKDLGAEVLHELIVEEIKDRITSFLVRKIGTKIIPFVNLASALYDLIQGEEERTRVRNALACMIVAIKGRTSDEMTISAKVLSSIMADQFGDAVMSAVAARVALGQRRLRGRGSPEAPARDTDATSATQRAESPADARTEPEPGSAPQPERAPPPRVQSHPVREPATGAAVAEHRQPSALVRAPGERKDVDRPPPLTGSSPAAPARTQSPPPPQPPSPPPAKTSGEDPRATADKGVANRAASEPTDDAATDRDGAILRIGVDRVRGEPPAPPANGGGSPPPPATDRGGAIMRIGVDRVRGEPPAPPAADGGPLPPPRKTSGDDPRATTDKGVTDRAASEPTHEEATHRDGAILRIGVDRIRGVDEGGTPLTTRRRALTRPDRPARSDQVGTPMGFKKEVGAPLVTSIGGAVVVSRHPHVLVGARTDHHRKDVLAIIAADPSHPLRPLLDPSSLASGKPRFRRSPYGRQGTLDDWRRHPEDWESGHVRSRKSGDAEVLIVQTRYRNRTQNRFLEHSGTGGEVTRERAVVIGGIAIEYGSAMDLFDAGFINLSRKEMDELPTIEF